MPHDPAVSPFQKNILDDLEEALANLSMGLADKSLADLSQEQLESLLHSIAQQKKEVILPQGAAKAKDLSKAMKLALANLAKVLAGPKAVKYKIGSSSQKGKYYTLEVDGGDVYCSCPGFEYRGMCSHSRTLKDGINKGNIPAAYSPVE